MEGKLVVTRRNFLKGIGAFLGSYATGTRIAIPETGQELQVVSEVHKVKPSPIVTVDDIASAEGRQSAVVDYGTDARLWQIDMKAEFGTPPSIGQNAEVYLVPEGVVDERACHFVGLLWGDGEGTRYTGQWLVSVPNGPFRVIAVGESLKEVVVDLSPLEIEIA